MTSSWVVWIRRESNAWQCAKAQAGPWEPWPLGEPWTSILRTALSIDGFTARAEETPVKIILHQRPRPT